MGDWLDIISKNTNFLLSFPNGRSQERIIMFFPATARKTDLTGMNARICIAQYENDVGTPVPGIDKTKNSRFLRVQ